MTSLRLTAIFVAVLVSAAVQTVSSAESIAYEWSGVLSRNGVDDALAIGDSEVPFTWRAVVSTDEVDIDYDRIDLVTFQNAQVTLWLDGFVDPLISSSAVIEAYDNSGPSPTYDHLFSGAEFEYQGASFGLGTAISFSHETYSFAAFVETPPVFDPATSVIQVRVGSFPYQSRVDVGTPLTATLVVPEPTAAALVGLVALAAFGRRRAG